MWNIIFLTAPHPHSVAHFPGLSPASFCLEPTPNNSGSLWAPCSRRTWTSTSFLPSPGILHFHHLQRDTGERRRRGRRGPNHYSFPLCAFIPSQQHQSNLPGLECRLKSSFDETTCVGPQEKNAPWVGGKKMWQMLVPFHLPSVQAVTVYLWAAAYKVNCYVITPAPPFCRSVWLVLVLPSAG